MCRHGAVVDPSSYSNFDAFQLRHVHLSWNVCFERQVVVGKAILFVRALKKERVVSLDTQALQIHDIKMNNSTLPFKVIQKDELGDQLKIELLKVPEVGDVFTLIITYDTTPEGSALLFLPSQMTSDGKGPYLYSQCQAIHARSIVPVFDSPSVKFTYTAQVSVPADLTCLMSALGARQLVRHSAFDITEEEASLLLKASAEPVPEGSHSFSFYQPVPVPAYLLAIVVGVLERRVISNRVAIWAEPSVVAQAALEFVETEVMLSAAEELLGPYRWTRYDLVVMPFSFPFGGMENPCLTFVTPTLLAGDGSLTGVIIHEIIHSWTGNLVTNANWEHFYLNEGFTVFCERKVAGKLNSLRAFQTAHGYDTLHHTVHQVFNPSHPLTKLVTDLRGIHPDDAFSSMPYEKGSAMLVYLEQLVGGPEKMDAFLKSYIKNFAYKSIVSTDFIEYFTDFFADQKSAVSSVDWDSWLHEPGMPVHPPAIVSLKRYKTLAAVLHTDPANEAAVGEFTDCKSVERALVLRFMTDLAPTTPVKAENVEHLANRFQLAASRNWEIRFNFLMYSIAVSPDAKYSSNAIDTTFECGRLKYVKPIATALSKHERSYRAIVVRFEQQSGTMHPITKHIVESVLKQAGKTFS